MRAVPLVWYIFGGGEANNDILLEAQENAVEGVLIELADNLTDSQVKLVAKCLQVWRGIYEAPDLRTALQNNVAAAEIRMPNAHRRV